MKTVDDRSEFDEALKDIKNVFLLLFGQTASSVEAIHDMAVKIITEPYKKTVWITKIGALTEQEKTAWYKADDQYTLLSRSTDSQKWVVVTTKPLADLCLTTGAPSARKIRAAFAEAEQQ